MSDSLFYFIDVVGFDVSGYIKLKKLEVLESTLHKETELIEVKKANSDDSIFTDSEKESIDSGDSPYATKGEELLQEIKAKMEKSDEIERNNNAHDIKLTLETVENIGRRYSGPVKQLSMQMAKSNLCNLENIRSTTLLVPEEKEPRDGFNNVTDTKQEDMKPRKSILKTARRFSGPITKANISNSRAASLETNFSEDTETSGYRSNASSRQNESSETESDYGYSTITESATPKKIELSLQSNYSLTSGVLPEESWTIMDVRAVNQWSDDEDEEVDDAASKSSLSRNLYERQHYLNSLGFMSNFVDNFIINLGSGLGLSQDAINNALTQGASIYCDSLKNGIRMGCEIFPALIAAWPNAANQWIIRERKIIQNPRTNFSYQWPTKYMVSKAIGFGCLLVPIGFRPKRGLNPEQTLQWKIIFPAAERYLESCLAHSHMRCYLFTLALHKTFMENESSKIGLDASHIKNHLFWQCEDNYAKWPEDRLGETLRLFLRSFYVHFGQSRFPNYFIENCNEFKSIPKPMLLKLQRRLADILESPVMHVLNAVEKLKYNKKDFYPTFNSYRLYEILTCKNPLRILNPNLPTVVTNYNVSSDSEEDTNTNFWDKAKSHDKHYQWKKERQRQMQERRRAQMNIKKQKSLGSQEKEINSKVSF